MTPRNKPRIFITLHPRGKNSLGKNRTRLGYSAYHWGILISPKHPTPSAEHTHFDVTDSMYIDPLTNGVKDDWRFRGRSSPEPVAAFQILARVYVGKLAFGTEGVRGRLSGIALPGRGVEGENCVSWTREAIGVLGDMGVLGEGFDLMRFMDVALGFADECLAGKREMGGVLDYGPTSN
ncbi:hypothetical protein BJX76DRAFT_369288 [Aspergillus varians]